MTDLEPSRAGQPDPPTPPAPPEPWSALWSWIVRLLGAAVIINQAFFEDADRQWLLLCAMGCLLGEVGLKAFLRFLLRNAGGES